MYSACFQLAKVFTCAALTPHTQCRHVRKGRLGNGLEWHFGKAAKCGLIKNVNCRYLYTDEVRQGEEDMKDPSK